MTAASTSWKQHMHEGVKKVVTASTASIYGMANVFPTSEDHHPYNNRTWYGASKIMLEGLLRAFNDMYGLPYIALRYFNVYGPRMDIHGRYTEVLIRWMDRIAAGQPPLIFGDGKQTMDFVYIEDVARANILASQSDRSDDVFNVASGVETSLNDLAQALLKVMKSDLQPEYGEERKVNPVPRRLVVRQLGSWAFGLAWAWKRGLSGWLVGGKPSKRLPPNDPDCIGLRCRASRRDGPPSCR